MMIVHYYVLFFRAEQIGTSGNTAQAAFAHLAAAFHLKILCNI